MTKMDYFTAEIKVYKALIELKELMDSKEFAALYDQLAVSEDEDVGLMYGCFESFVECELTTDRLL